LIVDDNAVNRRVLHEYVRSWGMRNGDFAQGGEALEIMRRARQAGDPYHIALLDYAMPDMDGETLGRAIKADPVLNNTVLLLLTSMGQEGDAPRFRGAGFAGYLVKPVRSSHLLEAIIAAWSTRQKLAAVSEARRCAVSRTAPSADSAARALVVDDNVVNQKAARLILGRLGCHVDVAGNGRGAVERVRTGSYDLVFMDCEMPEMDGYEATRCIRSLEGLGKHLPIIAMTAKALQGERERCLAAGMDDYIAKPVRFEDFQDVLARWKSRETVRPAETSVATATDDPAIDPAVLSRWRALTGENGGDLLGDLFDAYTTDSQRRLDSLKRHALDGDANQVRRAAHALKGASANVGASRVTDLCRELEIRAAAGDLSTIADSIETLSTEVRRAIGELEKHVGAGVG